MSTNNFSNHGSKLKLEALLRSILCGLAVGFGAGCVAAFVTWLTVLDGILIPIAAIAAATLISAPIFYLKRFRPTAIKNARRIDGLGLEERLITMVEFSNDDSVMARLQREDAKAALAKVTAERLKIKISKAAVLALVICFCLCSAMATVSILAEHGVIAGGDDLINNAVEEATTEWVNVTYIINEGGILEGDEDQMIVKGTNAGAVTAVADDGYVFKGWSDGSADPTREDKEITEDIVYIAEFTPLGDGQDGQPGDEGEESDEEEDSENEEPGEEGEDGDEESKEQPPQDPSQNENNNAGGKYDPNNQIIDGNTFYKEALESQYGEGANSQVEDPNNGLTDAQRELIKKYFGIV